MSKHNWWFFTIWSSSDSVPWKKSVQKTNKIDFRMCNIATKVKSDFLYLFCWHRFHSSPPKKGYREQLNYIFPLLFREKIRNNEMTALKKNGDFWWKIYVSTNHWHAFLRCVLFKTSLEKGLCTNHADRIWGIFDLLLPLRRHFYKIALIEQSRHLSNPHPPHLSTWFIHSPKKYKIVLYGWVCLKIFSIRNIEFLIFV